MPVDLNQPPDPGHGPALLATDRPQADGVTGPAVAVHGGDLRGGAQQRDPGLPRCTDLADRLGEGPVGTAPPWSRCLVVEVPAPWDADVARSRTFPEALRCALGGLDASTRLQCVLPDPEYSTADARRVMLFSRPAGSLSVCGRAEYVAPEGMAGELAARLAADGPGGKWIESHRADVAADRDVLVCTHGNRDACCGSFGVPVYEALRRMAGASGVGAGRRLRVWRTSHTGGHRFAPTLIDLPEGRYWGRLDAGTASSILARSGDVRALEGLYRGWSALGSAAEQSAEWAALARFGWEWTRAEAGVETVAAGPDGEGRTFRFEAARPGGPARSITVTVERAGAVPTMNCMKQGSKGDNPQFRIVGQQAAS